MKNFIGVLIGLVIISAVIVYGLYSAKKQSVVMVVTSFSECVAAGNAVMESYPRQCRTEAGQTFTEYIGNELEKTDLIRLNHPRPNQTISSPLTISGEARGFWFFEASFPFKLLDAEGKILTQTFATADGEWMTEEFVPFMATVEFSSTVSGSGLLILERDNPSGLPEHDDSLVVPLWLGTETEN